MIRNNLYELFSIRAKTVDSDKMRSFFIGLKSIFCSFFCLSRINFRWFKYNQLSLEVSTFLTVKTSREQDLYLSRMIVSTIWKREIFFQLLLHPCWDFLRVSRLFFNLSKTYTVLRLRPPRPTKLSNVIHVKTGWDRPRVSSESHVLRPVKSLGLGWDLCLLDRYREIRVSLCSVFSLDMLILFLLDKFFYHILVIIKKSSKLIQSSSFAIIPDHLLNLSFELKFQTDISNLFFKLSFKLILFIHIWIFLNLPFTIYSLK